MIVCIRKTVNIQKRLTLTSEKITKLILLLLLSVIRKIVNTSYQNAQVLLIEE